MSYIKKVNKNVMVWFGIFTLLIGATTTSASNGLMLKSPEWLSKNIENSKLILLHVGMPHDFEENHIPGSILLPFRDIITPRAPKVLSDEFPSYAKLDSVFESLGINTNSKIVVYYSDERFIPLATRTIITLEYLGFEDNVFLLNGGYVKWQSENISVEPNSNILEKGIIDKSLNNNFLINSDELNNNLSKPDYWIVDARPEDSYVGNDEGHFSRSGHIRGAINIPFTDFLDSEDANLFKTDKELLKIFNNYYINKNSEIVFYCGTGIWATVNYVIAKHLGFNKVKLYDGSFEDWSLKTELPIIEPLK